MSTNYSIDSPNTGATLASQASGAVRNLWQKRVDFFDQNNDFFKRFEGRGQNAPIQVKMETSKGAGQSITFTTMAGFYHKPKFGESRFHTDADFEKIRIASNSLTVDFVRNAVRITERAEEKMGMRGEIVAGLPDQLGKWMGRFKSEQIAQMFKYKGGSDNTTIAHSRATEADLTKNDKLDMSVIEQHATVLKQKNGMPATVGVDAAGNPIKKYCVVTTTEALASLEQDPDYRQQLRDCGLRGGENLLFKGGWSMLRGHTIHEWNWMDNDGLGPIGTPFAPRAELSAAITASTTAPDITGGGHADAVSDTLLTPFRWFPEYAYEWADGTAESAGSDTFYCVIYNPPGHTNAGKWGFYSFNANDGNTLTGVQRLRAAASGEAVTQLGNVVWDANKNTDAHAVGSIVILTNSSAVPIGNTLIMGSVAARRGYGKYMNKRGKETNEDGFGIDLFIKSVFGQAPRPDTRGRYPGYVLVSHAIDLPGINIDPTLA